MPAIRYWRWGRRPRGRCRGSGNRGFGGSGGIFSGQLLSRCLGGLLRGGFGCFLGSALGLPLCRALLGAGGGLLLPLFGAALDPADRADAIHGVRCNGLAAVGAEGLGALVNAHGAQRGQLAELHPVDAVVGAGRHADAALPAFPGGDHDAGLAVGQVFHLEGRWPGRIFSHLPQPKHLSVTLGR